MATSKIESGTIALWHTPKLLNQNTASTNSPATKPQHDYIESSESPKAEDKDLHQTPELTTVTETACTNNDQSKQLPLLDLHINLWRILDVKTPLKSKTNLTYLDIGFEIEKLQDYEQLCLFIPANIDRKDISDLAPILKNQETLKAVFNDIVKIHSTSDNNYTVKKTKNNNWSRRIWYIEEDDLGIENVNGDGKHGVIITIKGSLFNRYNNIPDNATNSADFKEYIRMRISLNDNGNCRFCITEIKSNTFGAVALQPKQEVIEFRLNERRSYPEEIETRAENGRIIINSVNYFLITNIDNQITTQHTKFKRVRQLEMSLWSAYILGRKNDSDNDTKREAENFISEDLTSKKLSTYQWKNKSDIVECKNKSDIVEKKTIGLEDFNAYATFASSENKIFQFYLLTVFLSVFSAIIITPLIEPFIEPIIDQIKEQLYRVEVAPVSKTSSPPCLPVPAQRP